MQEISFDEYAIPGIMISIETKNGNIITPAKNGFIGVFPNRKKLVITVTPETGVEHRCFTIDPRSMEKVLKKNAGVYFKNFTVDTSTGEGRVAAWPSNMICIETAGRTFNVGIFSQNGRFFFAVEEYLPDPEHLPYGMVIWFSLLRGIGAVSLENPIFNGRIHRSQISKDSKTGLRWCETGDLLKWTKLLQLTDVNTEFRYEARDITNISKP